MTTDAEYGGYPDEIGRIMINRCATAGCHNVQSHSEGLVLDTWQHLFQGGVGGAAIIPYSPKYSTLIYFINVDSANNHLPQGYPLMPQDNPPLTTEEFKLIYDWVQKGAPDRNGNIAFGSNSENRQKVYISQANDLVAVIDADSKLLMRYITLGLGDGVRAFPHHLQISQNGKFGFVGFTAGTYLQRINTSADNIETTIDLYPKTASGTVYISPDGETLLASYYNAYGEVFKINPANNSRAGSYINMTLTHGITTDEKADMIYVTSQRGNTVYKFPRSVGSAADIKTISLDGNPLDTAHSASTPDPHDILMLPDYTKYLITCENSNEIKIIDAQSDVVIATIPVGQGAKPQEIALSKKQHLAFVSCINDVTGTTSNLYKGSIFVFDYENPANQWHIYGNYFNYPHGIAVDDRNDVLYVASRNTDGPPDHHPSLDNNRNGYFQVFSSVPPFQTLNNGRKYYISIDPYSADIRFKDSNKP